MKMVYIDSEFKCHVSDDGTMREIQTDFFDGKCPEYIEGYRFVPEGETWTREDRKVFTGEMICPLRDYGDLAEIQTAVDRTQSEADLALAELIEEVYQSDMEMMGL